MQGTILFFCLFLVGILGILIFDLLILGRKSHEVSLREAAIWTGIWVMLAFLFALFLRFHGQLIHGIETHEELKQVLHRFYPYLAAGKGNFANELDLFRKDITINFISGYLVEESLSIDNLFVIMAILKAFSVSKADYKRVLFWGILGAIIMRFVFIFAGAALINRFEWLLYIFGAYLLYVGVRMYLERNRDKQIQPQDHPMVKFLSRRFRVFPRYVNNRFFLRKDHQVFITPLFIVLIMVELTDLIFALDSIPAVFGITRDPFVVFFSNIFAILGLRSLFFLLIKIVDRFYLLKVGVSLLLVFVGIKLIAHEWLAHSGYKPVYSLYIIAGILGLSIVLSILFPRQTKQIS
ncbi:MAG: TerC/Alx family metal homeostasis membrane protein [Bacteroidota bacterium]